MNRLTVTLAMFALATTSPALAGKAELSRPIPQGTCNSDDEVLIRPHIRLSFRAQQHRDESSRFSLMSDRISPQNPTGILLNDKTVTDIGFNDKSWHDLHPQAVLFDPSERTYCLKAPGWWQWGNGPNSHQYYVSVRKKVTTGGVTFNYMLDNSDNPGGILEIAFSRTH